MILCPFLRHALAPLHAAGGQAADVSDVPTADF